MNRTNIFFGESHSDWLPVRGGESGDFVFRRGDGHAFAKIAPASRRGELAGERDRLIWLKGRGVACPEVINWQEEQEGACLVITAIPGVPAADLSGADLLKAWPSMGQQLGAVHSLSVDQCPFERRLSRMFGRAVDVVSRNAVNPDFLPDEDKSTPQLDLLARVERELPVRLDQERTDMVVCHGDPCMPNFMVDPKTLQCTGLIDLGRLGTADRYADLALMIANAEENWAAPDEAERAFAVLFNVLGIEAPDRERLAFYLSALLPIRDRFAALFQRARDDQNAGCQTDYVHAAIIADQMMSNASELRGLHGDLHHENIMFSSRGWLVIDPVGLVGEVGFGAANMFYDPADRDDLCLDPRRIAQMADAFSRALDVDPRRLLDQAYAYGCLSAAWNADGEEEQRDLAIAAAIKQVRQTSY